MCGLLLLYTYQRLHRAQPDSPSPPARPQDLVDALERQEEDLEGKTEEAHSVSQEPWPAAPDRGPYIEDSSLIVGPSPLAC